MYKAPITNRLIESTAKLDKWATGQKLEPDIKTGKLKKIDVINCANESGLYIRLGRLSAKTGKLGSHSLYCRLKDGGKHRICRLDDIYLKKADKRPGQLSLRDAKAVCKRWRENGAPDHQPMFEQNPTANKQDDGAQRYSVQFCFEKWCTSDVRGRPRRKAKNTLDEAQRDYETNTPKDWLSRPIVDISTAEIRDHAESLRDHKWRSTKTGKKVGTRGTARRWLTTMSSIFSESVEYHEGEVNRFGIVLRKYPKSAGGHRALTDEEIAAVINIKREQCNTVNGKPNPHLWLRMLALKFALLSGFRRSAIVGLKIADINGEAIERDEADKSFNAHKLSIPAQLREILDGALALKNGDDPEVASDATWKPITESEYLFCSSTGNRYSKEAELFKFPLKRLRKAYELKPVKGRKQSEAKHFTPHCCRYTIETVAHRLGLNAKPILNHAERKDISDVYRDLSDDDERIAFERTAKAHQQIVDHLYEIAARNAS